MGITPIISLSPLPVARPIQADLDPLPMARVENSARTGDETYSPSNGKSASGSEDEGSEDVAFEDDLASPDNEDTAVASAESTDTSQSHPISFFA